jgi:hypothetical protein
MKFILLPFLSLLFLSGITPAASLQRERLIAERIIQSDTHAETVWLDASRNRFLALHRKPPNSKILGGIVLLHDRESHPQMGVIRSLASGLADRGWETLAIQLPLAAQVEANAYPTISGESEARILAAIGFFSDKQNRNLALLGHGLGARLGFVTLKNTPQPSVRALVAIGMPAYSATVVDPASETIVSLQIPVLEILGKGERRAVIHSADLRQAQVKRAGFRRYRQDWMTGADHEFHGLGDSLVNRVAAWLGKVAAGVETESTSGLFNPPASMP